MYRIVWSKLDVAYNRVQDFISRCLNYKLYAKVVSVSRRATYVT